MWWRALCLSRWSALANSGSSAAPSISTSASHQNRLPFVRGLHHPVPDGAHPELLRGHERSGLLELAHRGLHRRTVGDGREKRERSVVATGEQGDEAGVTARRRWERESGAAIAFSGVSGVGIRIEPFFS
jgi:hypothetical protein